jgi:large subunit ribosomal protein L15
MQRHTLKTRHHGAKKVRIGRGGKRGSFSGRGIKGQKARAGRRIRPEMRDLIKKIPKKRGHRHTGPIYTIATVSSALIAKKFKVGENVNPKTLLERGLISRVHGRTPSVKILGKKLFLAGRVVTNCAMSQDAKS